MIKKFSLIIITSFLGAFGASAEQVVLKYHSFLPMPHSANSEVGVSITMAQGTLVDSKDSSLGMVITTTITDSDFNFIQSNRALCTSQGGDCFITTGSRMIKDLSENFASAVAGLPVSTIDPDVSPPSSSMPMLWTRCDYLRRVERMGRCSGNPLLRGGADCFLHPIVGPCCLPS